MTANGNDMRGEKWRILCGSAAKRLVELPDASIDCCVTSPPYWGLRDYGVEGQLGLEPTPAEYVERLVEVFREVRRVLKDDGTLWLNLGDSYVCGSQGSQGGTGQRAVRTFTATRVMRKDDIDGLAPKNLVGIPWRVAFALQADGWYLRSDIIWAKPNPMPESVTDRPTKAHEYLFLLSKSERYYYDAGSIAEQASSFGLNGGGYEPPGQTPHATSRGVVAVDAPTTRNKRSVWTIPTEPFPGAHFAVMPTALVKPCVLAGCRPGGTVLDPFTGSGTVCRVSVDNNCQFVGTELKPDYVRMAAARMAQDAFAFDIQQP